MMLHVWSAFVIKVVAMYTANLSPLFGNQQFTRSIEGIEDIYENKVKAFSLSSVQTFVDNWNNTLFNNLRDSGRLLLDGHVLILP